MAFWVGRLFFRGCELKISEGRHRFVGLQASRASKVPYIRVNFTIDDAMSS